MAGSLKLDNVVHTFFDAKVVITMITSLVLCCAHVEMQVDPGHVEGKRLLQRLRASRKEQTEREKMAARRMCSGAEGFSEAHTHVSHTRA